MSINFLKNPQRNRKLQLIRAESEETANFR
jgi:hypothetical protein